MTLDAAAMLDVPTLEAVTTPALLLDKAKLLANIDRGAARARAKGFQLRPHLKTAKSMEIANLVLEGRDGPITVSTLGEAEYFGAGGLQNIFYAVPISPAKLTRARALLDSGVRLSILTDTLQGAEAVAGAGYRLPTFIEVDTDGHRGGLTPADPRLIEAAEALQATGCFAGLMAHAGGSYAGRSEADAAHHAAQERAEILKAAAVLRASGIAVPAISIGSTPTMLFGDDYSGITEVRAGVYMFQDLVMAGVGVCRPEEIALSVLTTVIGQRPDRNQVFVDAGWMAMSRDRGTANHPIDQGYGAVATVDGELIDDLIVNNAFQEHGIVESRSGAPVPLERFPVGTRLRILPNHACATAAQHDSYLVLEDGRPVAHWPRMRGW